MAAFEFKGKTYATAESAERNVCKIAEKCGVTEDSFSYNIVKQGEGYYAFCFRFRSIQDGINMAMIAPRGVYCHN